MNNRYVIDEVYDAVYERKIGEFGVEYLAYFSTLTQFNENIDDEDDEYATDENELG